MSPFDHFISGSEYPLTGLRGVRVKSPIPEIANSLRDLFAVGFQGEVPGVEKADDGLWQIAAKRLRPGGQKVRIVFAP
jgi:hypothetical protein